MAGRFRAAIGIVLAVALVAACDGSSPTSSSSATTLPGQSVAPTTAAVGSPGASVQASPPSETEAPTAGPPTAAPPTPKPSPTPNTNPKIVKFEAPKQEDCTGSSGGSVHLSWTIKNATGVTISIDGPGIYDSYDGLNGSVDLPYGCSPFVLEHTYTLTTTGGSGPADDATRRIITRAPSIVSFTVDEPECAGGGFVGVNMSYEIRAATGAELRRDGEVYSTYGTKTTDDIVLFDCSKTFQTFRLTTTGGYGTAAQKDLIVNRPQH